MVAFIPFRSIAGAALLTATTLSFAPAVANAQLELPQPSPKAKVEQQVGVTTFSLSYSSPAVNGRTIWGELVPYDEVWRTGANAATTFTSTKDFSFGGTKVPAGTYSLFTIPGQKSWTVVLNSNPRTWGNTGYDSKLDVARIVVKPRASSESRERLAFLFSETTEDSTRLDLEWEKLRVSIPVGTDTAGQVTSHLERAIADSWRPTHELARWYLEHDGDLKKALELANTSIGIKPTWSNHWVKAQIQAKGGKKSDALKTAKHAQKLGEGDSIYPFYVDQITAAIAGWQK